MKANNYIVFIVSAIVAAFLLWLWFFLGFNKVDNPLDLVIAIVWWVLVIGLAVGVSKVELKRQKQVRTIYVADAQLFNSEAGVTPAAQGERTAAMKSILEKLEYSFDKADMPTKEAFDCKYVVQTEKYEAKDNGSEVWQGKVIKIDRANGNTETAFDGAEQLMAAMA